MKPGFTISCLQQPRLLKDFAHWAPPSLPLQYATPKQNANKTPHTDTLEAESIYWYKILLLCQEKVTFLKPELIQ